MNHNKVIKALDPNPMYAPKVATGTNFHSSTNRKQKDTQLQFLDHFPVLKPKTRNNQFSFLQHRTTHD